VLSTVVETKLTMIMLSLTVVCNCKCNLFVRVVLPADGWCHTRVPHTACCLSHRCPWERRGSRWNILPGFKSWWVICVSHLPDVFCLSLLRLLNAVYNVCLFTVFNGSVLVWKLSKGVSWGIAQSVIHSHLSVSWCQWHTSSQCTMHCLVKQW